MMAVLPARWHTHRQYERSQVNQHVSTSIEGRHNYGTKTYPKKFLITSQPCQNVNALHESYNQIMGDGMGSDMVRGFVQRTTKPNNPYFIIA